jgi:hypothetical protein
MLLEAFVGKNFEGSFRCNLEPSMEETPSKGKICSYNGEKIVFSGEDSFGEYLGYLRIEEGEIKGRKDYHSGKGRDVGEVTLFGGEIKEEPGSTIISGEYKHGSGVGSSAEFTGSWRMKIV